MHGFESQSGSCCWLPLCSHRILPKQSRKMCLYYAIFSFHDWFLIVKIIGEDKQGLHKSVDQKLGFCGSWVPGLRLLG